MGVVEGLVVSLAAVVASVVKGPLLHRIGPDKCLSMQTLVLVRIS